MGIILYNGVSSQDFGIQVEHPPGYHTPRKDYDKIHVPGKNGDVVIYKKSYENVSREYPIAFGDLNKDFTQMANAVSNWLNAPVGYCRLEDSYEPDYYRLAIYEDETDITNILQHAGRATIVFNCKPQRFLKIGDEPVILKSKSYVNNPTKYSSLPIINVKGNGDGVLKVGNYTITIKNIDGSITVNSEIQDCYKGTLNKNQTVTLAIGYPKLEPGDNEITFSGGINELEVIPKWWTL